MSTISAGTTTGTALVTSGDTTGQLVLQTNGTTTAVTIGTNQVVTLAQPLPATSGGTGLTSPGANGNILTSNGTAWVSAAAPAGSEIIRQDRTSNTILGTANRGNLINITSGTFTQTFTAAATLGSGWFCYIANNGTGDITLDPNASETIDGLTSYIMYPGECRLVQCNGTNFITEIVQPFSATFTATGTFTKPPGYRYFSGLLWGGGGSGAASSTSGGGGGGACVPFTVLASDVSASQTITIGAGGTGVVSGAGNAGGNSTIVFGSKTFTAYGGGRGSNNSGGGGGGALGAGESGSSGWVPGGAPDYGASSSNKNNNFGGGQGAPMNTVGGASVYGGGGGGGGEPSGVGGTSIYGGGGGSGSRAGAGGVSIFGGNGGTGVGTSGGGAGTAPGGGGGGADGNNSGAGARGECRIWGIA